MIPTTCPARDVLSAFFDGKLSAAEVESWSPHVESCQDCLAVLEELSESTAQMPRSSSISPSTATRVVGSKARLWEDLSAIGLLNPERLSEMKLAASAALNECGSPALLADWLVEQGILTPFQSSALLEGRGRKLVLGEYILLDLIGVGGMGQVYKARHRRMDRIVALKVLAGEIIANSDAVKRFQREVRAAARLEHPHVVTAYDAGEADGVHFLVMQYVAGRDLATISRQRGPLPVGEAVSYILQAARGLAYAHGEGLIHRDIKPGNMLVDRKGTLKILDLGLARLDHADFQHSELTGSGQVMGTVDYMSPEQAADTRSADARSDIYSLGCTFYRLLAGEVPYPRDSLVNTVLAHREAPIPRLGKRREDVPPELDELCAAMMAKSPADRPQTMQQVVERFERFSTGAWQSEATELLPEDRFGERQATPTARREDTLTLSKGKTATGIKLPRPRRIYVALGAAALALIACGMVIWAMTRPAIDKQPPSAASAPNQSPGNVLSSTAQQEATVLDPEMFRASLWQPGHEIRVAFLNGDEQTQRRIEEIARQWTAVCNLSFRFVPSADKSDIRVSIVTRGTGYSSVGTACRAIPSAHPTLVINAPAGRSAEAFTADVLNLFGHALGLRHEHLNPNAHLPIDREATCAFYRPLGLSRDQVDVEFFQHDNNEVYGFNKPFDPDSVMFTALPREILTRDYTFKVNATLSPGDRELVSRLYPFFDEPEIADALFAAKVKGFWVTTVNGEPYRIARKQDLPAAPFSITAITCMYQDFPMQVLPSLLSRGKLGGMYVAGCPNIDDEVLRSLAGRLHLHSLSTVNTAVTGAGLVDSGQLEYLLEFYLSRKQLTPAVASELNKARRLTQLSIYDGCEQTTLEQVARISSLQFLLIDDGVLDLPQGFGTLAVLPSLEKVGLESLRGLTAEHLQTLLAHRGVRELSIYHTNLTPQHVDVLRQARHLTRLSLNDCGLEPTAAQTLQESLAGTTLKWDGVVIHEPPAGSSSPQ